MEKAVRKGRLPMIDMGYNAEIPNVRCVHLLTFGFGRNTTHVQNLNQGTEQYSAR